jgi:hypothetical protein
MEDMELLDDVRRRVLGIRHRDWVMEQHLDEDIKLKGGFKRMRRLCQELEKEVAGLKALLKEGYSDGAWDPMEGYAQDIAAVSRKILNLTKNANAHRDKRRKGF